MAGTSALPKAGAGASARQRFWGWISASAFWAACSASSFSVTRHETVLISAIHLLWLGGLALGFIGTGEISDLLADFTRTILIPSVFHVNP
jgi:hypothetical protein